MSDDLREKIAARCLAVEEGGYPGNLGWAEKIVRDCKDQEHYGDCTKFPAPCSRCWADDAYRYADAIMALLAPALREARLGALREAEKIARAQVLHHKDLSESIYDNNPVQAFAEVHACAASHEVEKAIAALIEKELEK